MLTFTSQVMLVDLARNDVNRVCDPLSTRVDRLMVVQKVSSTSSFPRRLTVAVSTECNSFRMCNILSQKSRAFFDRARRDLTRSVRSSRQVRKVVCDVHQMHEV